MTDLFSADEQQACGLTAALNVISGKWKPTIIWQLHARPLRFGELRRRIPGISEKILSEQLKELQLSGIVHREEFDERGLRVEYSLTPPGSLLNRAVHTLAEWGSAYGTPPVPNAACQG